jgi:hypothetical protein
MSVVSEVQKRISKNILSVVLTLLLNTSTDPIPKRDVGALESLLRIQKTTASPHCLYLLVLIYTFNFNESLCLQHAV